MNIDIVRAHYAASAQGNIDEMMANVSAQVRWTEMAGFPCAGTWVGPHCSAARNRPRPTACGSTA